MITGTVEVKGEVKLDKERNKTCRTQRGREPPLHMDCYKGIRRTANEWSSDSNSDSDEDEGESQREMTAERSHEGESLSGTPGKEREGAEPSSCRSAQAPLVFDLQEELRRSQRKKRAPKTYSGVYPILVKGQQAQYIPWGFRDLEGIVSK